MRDVSCEKYQVGCINHVGCIMQDVSYGMYHAGCIMSLMWEVSSGKYQAGCIMQDASIHPA